MTKSQWHNPVDNWSAEKIKKFRQDLLAWYDQEKRDLPWRRTQNPYHIWVSEIMLQQTQVETVIPYFENFIALFPTVQDLAAAEEEAVMRAWQGLGYYSRARNLQAAACQVVKDFQGQLPQNMKDLLSLKGIGPYTAGAIGSMAFGLVEPAIDGNLMRVTARLFELDLDISKAKNRKYFDAILRKLIDPDRPGDFNQALMDLGARVMTPTNDRPDPHPLAAYDQSYQKGTSHLYPVKKSKVKVSSHQYLAYVVRNGQGDYLMTKHDQGQLLASLWHFPLIEYDLYLEGATDQEMLEPLEAALKEVLNPDFSLTLDQPMPLSHVADGRSMNQRYPALKHVFSHRIWWVQPIGVRAEGVDLGLLREDWQWVKLDGMQDLPISTLQKKLWQAVGYEEEE